jgi:ADP-ribose pyrophosphatase YjhB (NUDIX family)
MYTPRRPKTGKWNSFDDPKPYCVVSGFAYDSKGFFPLLWRGPNVRSAKNCWSIPSGLHESGLTLEQQFITELNEELGLRAIKGTADLIGAYENIASDESWHWTIFIFTARVKDMNFVNKEPDKHPKIETVHYSKLSELVRRLKWAPNLKQALSKYNARIVESIKNGLK